VWAGRLTNDTLGPLRTVLGSGQPRKAGSPALRPLAGPEPRFAIREPPAVLRALGHAIADRPAERERPLVTAARGGGRRDDARGMPLAQSLIDRYGS